MTSPAKIAVILTGGQGARMGGADKGMLMLDGQRLVDRAHARLRAQGCEVYISGPHDYGLNLPCIADDVKGPKGPVAGLFSISTFLHDTGDAEGFITIPVDSPLFPQDLCEKLFSITHSTVAEDDVGLHPVFGWWRQNDLLPLWARLDLGNSLSLKAIAGDIGAQKRTWVGRNLFFNINTPNDVAKAAIMLDPAKKRR